MAHTGVSVRDLVDEVEDEDLDPLEPKERQALDLQNLTRAMNFMVLGLPKLPNGNKSRS